MREVGYDSGFTFKYSVREHTRAYRLGDSVSEAEKGRRLSAVIELQESISMARNQAEIGQVRRRAGRRAGAARRRDAGRQNAPVQNRGVPGAARPGDTVPVRITSASSHSLSGVPA